MEVTTSTMAHTFGLTDRYGHFSICSYFVSYFCLLGSPADEIICYPTPGDLPEWEESDRQLLARCLEVLRLDKTAPRFTFLYLGAVDGTGHAFGYSSDGRQYIDAMKIAFGQVEQVLEKIVQRRQAGTQTIHIS